MPNDGARVHARSPVLDAPEVEDWHWSWERTDKDPGGLTPPDAAPALPAVPTRVCPRCSAQEATTGAFCPHCGVSYLRQAPRRRSRRSKIIRRLIPVAVLIAAGGTAVGLKVKHDNDAAKQRDAHQQAAAAAEQRNNAKRDQRDHLVADLQDAVKKDAQKDVRDGLLSGPITTTSCEPSDGSAVTDLSVHSAAFTCLAANKLSADGTLSGYRFTANVNYDTGDITWHLGS